MVGIFPEETTVFGSGVGSVFALQQQQSVAADASPTLTFGPGQASSPLAQSMLKYQAEIMGQLGVPDELATPESARAANEAALAKLATVNPEMAQQLAERMTGDEEDKGIFDHLKDLAGDVLSPVVAIGGKLLDLITRPGRIVPELIVDEESDPWYEDVGQALAGNSEATGADVMEKWGVDSNFWKAVGGFTFDVAADPLTYLTGGFAGVGKALAARTTGTSVASKWLAGRLAPMVGTSIMPGADVAKVADDLIRNVTQKAGVHKDMAEGMTAFAMNDEMEKLTAAALEFGDVFGKNVRSRTLNKIGKDVYLSSIDETVPVAEGMRILKALEKSGNWGTRKQFMEARAAAAAFGGRRFRVYIPGTPMKYISPALPGTEKLSMGASRVAQLFSGQSGLARLSTIVSKSHVPVGDMSGPGIRLGDSFAGWEDVEALRSGGWNALKNQNEDLYHYLKGGGIRGGSWLVPMAEQLGGITIHLTPGGWAARSGSLLGSMSTEAKLNARDHVVNFMGENGFVVKDDSGNVVKRLTEVRKDFSIYERMSAERSRELFDFNDSVPDEVLARWTAGEAAEADDPFFAQFEQWRAMAPEEKTAVDTQRKLLTQTLDAANLEGARVDDVRSSLSREAVVLPSQGREYVKNAHAQSRDVMLYVPEGAEHMQMAGRGAQTMYARTTGGYGRALKLVQGEGELPIRPTAEGVPMVARLENPIVIDEATGNMSEASILDEVRGEAEKAVKAAKKPEGVFTPEELKALEQEQVDNFITEILGQQGRDGIIHIDAAGKKTMYVFKTNNSLVRKAKVLSIEAPRVVETQGFMPRMTTDSWDNIINGAFDSDPDLLRKVKGEVHRRFIHKNVGEAEDSIKTSVMAELDQLIKATNGPRKAQLQKITKRLKSIDVYERNPLKVHQKYLRTIAERVADARLGTFVERVERLNDLGAFGVGGAVNAPVFHYVNDHDHLREVDGLRLHVEEAAGKAVGHHWAVLTEQEKALAVKAEEFAKLRATLKEQRKRFPVAGSHKKIAVAERRVAVAGEKAGRAMNEYNRLMAKYRSRVQDIKPALAVGTPPADGWSALKIRGYEDHFMPAPIADEINTAIRQRGVGDMNRWFRQVVMGPWKRWSTIYYPGFHIRNNMGAFFNNYLGGVEVTDYNDAALVRFAKDDASKVGARKVREWNAEWLFRERGLNAEDVTWHDIKVLVADFGMSGSNSRGISDIDSAIDIMEDIAKPKGKVRRAAAKVTESTPAEGAKRLAMHATETTENLHRTAAFLQGLKQFSGDPYAARSFTMMRHGDYLDLTDFEHRTMKTLIPFYKWMRTNLPFQLRQLMENPAKQLGTLKAGDALMHAVGLDPDEENRLMPDWMKETFKIPIPGKDKVDYLTLDLPMSDLFTGTNEYVSMFLPTIRPFVENAVGKSFFTGGEIKGELVPLASWAQVPVIRDLLAPFTQENGDGQLMIDDKAQNLLSIIPIFSRSRNFLMADPERVKYRFHAFASTVFGVGVRPIDDEELTDQERAFFYQEIEPQLEVYRQLGVQLPSKDEVSAAAFSALGFAAPVEDTLSE